MKRITLAVVVGALLLASLVMAVSAQQGDVLARVQPLLVTIQQQVPVSVTLSIPLDDGEVQTVTVPMALDLNLEIALSSTMSPVVSVGAAAAGVVVSDLPADVSEDNNGIAFEVETVGDVELVQVRSDPDYWENFSLTGEIRNTGDEAVETYSVRITLTVYDEDGKILDTFTVSPSFGPIGAGQSSPFDVALSDTAMEDVGRYRLQISLDD
jgi:hypothetical protein